MQPGTLIAIIAGIVLPLQGITVAYVISIEHRITRIESAQEFSAPRFKNQNQTEAKQ